MLKPTGLHRIPVATVACFALLFPVVSGYGFHDAEAALLRTENHMTHSLKALPEAVDLAVHEKDKPGFQGTLQSNIPAGFQGIHPPSFLGGAFVGVAVTCLIVGLLTDNISGKSETFEKSAATEPDPESIAVDHTSSASNAENTQISADGHPESLHLFWHRAGWLCAMLLIQSISSLILDAYRDLMREHVDLAFFLTMLVGLGGNAGCQSVVLTVRRLAQGKATMVLEQVRVGALLAVVMTPLAFLRAYGQSVSFEESVVIGLSAATICVTATALGAGLPKLLYILKVDPAHSAVVVQVLMDIMGISIVCAIGYFMHHHVEYFRH